MPLPCLSRLPAALATPDARVTLPAFGAASYIPSIVLERALFVRERNDGLYRVITYLLAKMIDEVRESAGSCVVGRVLQHACCRARLPPILPPPLCPPAQPHAPPCVHAASQIGIAIVTTLLVSTFVWFGVGLSGTFAVFWCVYFVTLCCGIILAYLVASIAPNMVRGRTQGQPPAFPAWAAAATATRGGEDTHLHQPLNLRSGDPGCLRVLLHARLSCSCPLNSPSTSPSRPHPCLQ